jgi:hypothetical protein
MGIDAHPAGEITGECVLLTQVVGFDIVGVHPKHGIQVA